MGAFLEGTLAALATQRWLTSTQAIWWAEQRPCQLAVVAQLGFTLPCTIATNDQADGRTFAQERWLVAKAVSSGYIAGSNGNQAVLTSALAPADLQDLDGLVLAPVTFQENVGGFLDIRVTVVGDEVFSGESLSRGRESSKLDWRATDDLDLEHRMHEVPPAFAYRCLRLVSHLGLICGAIDFTLKPGGTYVFFEINPSGEWLWLEDQVVLPISDRIAAWLCA